MVQNRLDAVINLAKRRGFVFQAGEIYGGSRSAWDYGPLGVALKENIKRQWWKTFVQGRDDMVGLDSSIILPHRRLARIRPRRHLHRPARRVPAVPQAPPPGPPRGGVRGEEGPRSRLDGGHHLPRLRHHGQVDRAADVLRPHEDLPRPGRQRGRPALPAPRDGAGHLRELLERRHRLAQEAAVRHRPGRQGVPQRDHARQLHLPHARVRADGDRVLHRARRRAGSGSTAGSRRAGQWFVDLGVDPANMRRFDVPDEERAHYSAGTIDVEYRFGFQGSEWGELDGHREPHRLRPLVALEGVRQGPRLLRPGDRRALHARTSSSRRSASRAA